MMLPENPRTIDRRQMLKSAVAVMSILLKRCSSAPYDSEGYSTNYRIATVIRISDHSMLSFVLSKAWCRGPELPMSCDDRVVRPVT